MSDLLEKFAALELSTATRHTELMEALNTIAYALGAPPTTPTTTLADVVTALNAMTTAQLTQHNALMEAVDQIVVNTDTIITNNSLNAQRIIAAILTTACACSGGPPLLPNPLDVTPTTLVDDAKCRRIQYYLSVFGALVDSIANYGGTGAAITSGALAEMVIAAAASAALVGGEVGAVAGPPGIVIGAVISVIGAIIAGLGSAYMYSLSNQWHQAPLGDELLAALYAADSADTGAEAFYNTIGASGVLDTIFKPLINALFWNGWANDIYSGVPTVDDSAFDGTICAPPPTETCQTYPFTMRADAYGIVIFGTKETPGDVNDPWIVGDFAGWRVRYVVTDFTAEIVVTARVAGGGIQGMQIFNTIGQTFIVDRATIAMSITTRYNNTITSGTMELCPPGTF